MAAQNGKVSSLEMSAFFRLDQYDRSHLVEHLAAGKLTTHAHRLLATEVEGGNAWYQMWIEEGTLAAYLDDIRLVLQTTLDEEGAGSSGDGEVYGLQSRYALVLASINSLATNMEPGLMLSLVNAGVWGPSQGVAYAQQVTEPIQRAEVMGLLLAVVPKESREPVAESVFDVLMQLNNDDPVVRILSQIAPFTPPPLYPRMFEVANTVKRGTQRAPAFTICASYLPEPQRTAAIDEALRAADQISHDGEYERAMTRIASLVPSEMKDRIRRWTGPWPGKIGLAEQRVGLVLEMAEERGEPVRSATLKSALDLVEESNDRQDRLRALLRLAPHLPLEIVLEYWGAALPQPVIAHEIEALVEDLPYGSVQSAYALAAAAVHLAGDERRTFAEHAWESVSFLGDELEGAELLARVIPAYAGDELEAKVQQVLELLDRAKMEPPLPPAPAPRSRGYSSSFGDIDSDDEFEGSTGWRFDSDDDPWEDTGKKRRSSHDYARDMVFWVKNVERRCLILAALSRHVAEPRSGEMAEMCRATLREIVARPDETTTVSPAIEDWAEILGKVALLLPERQQEEILSETFDRITALESKLIRRNIFDKLAPGLPARWLRRALNMSQLIGDEANRSKTLAVLATDPTVFSLLSAPMRDSIGLDKLKALLAVSDAGERRRGLEALVPTLSENLLAQVVGTSRAQIEHVWSNMDGYSEAEASWASLAASDLLHSLTQLAPNLPEHLQAEVVACVRATSDNRVQTAAITALAGRLSPRQAEELQQIAGGITDEMLRAEALHALQFAGNQEGPDSQHIVPPEEENGPIDFLASFFRMFDDDEERDEDTVETGLDVELPNIEELAKDPTRIGSRWTELVEALSSEEQARLLTMALDHLMRQENTLMSSYLSEHNTTSRSRGLDELRPALLGCDLPLLKSLWLQHLLPKLIVVGRPALLADISALAPVIERLGGKVALAAGARAVEDVGRWWP